MLTEFNTTVKNFDHLCNINAYSTQFNVFSWLFQQQPHIAQIFLQQSHASINKPAEPNLVKEPSINLEKSLNESDSFHEYLTPETLTNTEKNIKKQPIANLNRTPQLYLDKPIGNINFPNNLDIFGSMKNSASNYNTYKSKCLRDFLFKKKVFVT